MELTCENVENTFKDCLFRDDEDTGSHTVAEGITLSVGFHPERLESHRKDVASMLGMLPDDFQPNKGGGASFLNACDDKDGRQWGEHRQMELLFLLGIGLKLAQWLMPKEMWGALPGGMPYAGITS